jgi:hypothetical protein
MSLARRQRCSTIILQSCTAAFIRNEIARAKRRQRRWCVDRLRRRRRWTAGAKKAPHITERSFGRGREWSSFQRGITWLIAAVESVCARTMKRPEQIALHLARSSGLPENGANHALLRAVLSVVKVPDLFGPLK